MVMLPYLLRTESRTHRPSGKSARLSAFADAAGSTAEWLDHRLHCTTRCPDHQPAWPEFRAVPGQWRRAGSGVSASLPRRLAEATCQVAG